MQPVAMHTNMLRHRDDNKESRPVDVGGEDNLDSRADQIDTPLLGL